MILTVSFFAVWLAVTFLCMGLSMRSVGMAAGPKAQVTNWRDKYGIPVPMGVLALVIELSTVVCMALGFFVGPVAFGLAVFMAFAILSHWEHGFFLSSAAGRGSGIEYTMALMLMALTITVGGAGALSVDILLSR